MKIEIEKSKILLIPENEPEKAYLESVFSLREDGDTCQAKRMDAGGISVGGWAYLELTPKEQEK